MACSITVLPALGGDTISARWPKPSGQIRSTTRWVSAVRGLDARGDSSTSGRAGCTAPSLANSGRSTRRPGGAPFTLATLPFSSVTRSPRRSPGRGPVHSPAPAVLERDETAATQPREPHAGISLGGQIAVGGEPHGAAVGGGGEPAGDGGQRASVS